MLSPVPALSRVNPLLQVLHRPQDLCSTCRSGFTRERAGTSNTLMWCLYATGKSTSCAPAYFVRG
ncbi:hypothetical protein C1882_00635 [Pseudomonas sp. FW305-E2]|nr:hypothetical protein C1882_00635 [Pseudomonas sp. FW305-E2]